MNDFISDPEEPPAKRHQIGGASGRDTPLVSVGGVSPENSSAKCEREEEEEQRRRRRRIGHVCVCVRISEYT